MTSVKTPKREQLRRIKAEKKDKEEQKVGGLCAVCGMEVSEVILTRAEWFGEKLYIFDNVPTSLCDTCGEEWIDHEVIKAMDKLIREGRPIRKMEIPIFDFAPADVK